MLAALALLAILGAFWGRIFSRAGYSPWFAMTLLVPLLNLYMMGKIVVKAGYNVAWTLLVLVPVLNAVMVLVFAFSEWPADRELRIKQMRMVYGSGK